jgi:mannose-6-phosphate isomerase-like protein (cupin superfamily)
MKWLFPLVFALCPLLAREPLANRIVHNDTSKYRLVKAVHDGAGQMHFFAMLDDHSLDTNLFFFHRGVLDPKSGIGHHFHNQCEEMFVILDGEAQFTIDGRTSLLKGPAGAICRMGHSHAIYNATDQPVEWMNINVTVMKGTYDAFNLGDPRVGVRLDPIPVFMTMQLDRALLKPFESMHHGEGTVQYRRALDPSLFKTPWAYVDHLVIPPNASVGPHVHHEQAEFYYVMNGSGTVTIAPMRGTAETASIKTGDAIPIELNEIHSFANTGSDPLEFMIGGISRDSNKRIDDVDMPFPTPQMPAR